MVPRKAHAQAVSRLLRQFPVVALLGARQVGKSTLARHIADASPGSIIFDLEDPRAIARLREPMLALEPLRGLVVLDEIQHRPELFPVLRVLADRPRRPARFLVLGSASPELLRQTSESLAGRIAHHHLPGLDLDETGAAALDTLWLRGGFPRAFTARSDGESLRWRAELMKTLVERDLPALEIRLPPATITRFWRMLAHYHAQVWNAAELARAFGVSEKTVRGYLEILNGTFMVRQLRPWHENSGKREVKSPKVYLSDPGLLHAQLGLGTRDDLLGHPKVGASWEGFAIQQITRRLGAEPSECFFWGVHTGAELDLLIVRGQERRGFEVKLTDTPAITPSMRSALLTLKLSRLDVIHAGAETFPLGAAIRAVALRRLWSDVRPL
jgi:uncharacterized protein